jgi:hypothetical protein
MEARLLSLIKIRMRNKKFCEKKPAGNGNTRCDPNPNSRTSPTKHYCKVDAQEDRGGTMGWDDEGTNNNGNALHVNNDSRFLYCQRCCRKM